MGAKGKKSVTVQINESVNLNKIFVNRLKKF